MKYYLYGKVNDDGIVTDTFSRPIWYLDNGQVVDDNFLAIHENIYPIETTLDPNIDLFKYIALENDKSEFILDKTKNIIVNYYTYIERELHDLKSIIYANIINIKQSKIYSDIKYIFPNNIVGIIQINDFENLSHIRALGFMAVVNPDRIFEFIDTVGNIHEMSSSQIIDMVMFIENNIYNIINTFNKHISNINLLNSTDDLLKYNSTVY